VEAARLKTEQQSADLDAARAELAQERLNSTVTLVAVEAGIAPGTIEAITKLADLDAAVVDGVVDRDAVKAAVEQVVEKFPGLAGTPGTPHTAPVGAGPATADAAKPEPASLADAIAARLGGN